MRRLWIMLALFLGGCANAGVEPAALDSQIQTGSIASPVDARRGGARRAAQSAEQSRRGGAPACARVPCREGRRLHVSEAERGDPQGHGNGGRRGCNDETRLCEPCSRPALPCSTSPTERNGRAALATRESSTISCSRILRVSGTPRCASGRRSASGNFGQKERALTVPALDAITCCELAPAGLTARTGIRDDWRDDAPAASLRARDGRYG